MKMQAMLILCALALMNCKKEGPMVPPPCNTCPDPNSRMVWQAEIDSLTKLHFLYANPLTYEGNPVFGAYRFSDCNYGSADRISCYHADTGVKLWSINPQDTCSHIEQLHLSGDVLIVHLTREILAYNLKDRSLIWSYPILWPLSPNVGSEVIGDHFYLSMELSTSSGLPPVGSLLAINLLTGQSREICRFAKEDWKGQPVTHPPSLWVDPSSGDSLLMVAVGIYNSHLGPFGSRASLHAYDLKSGTYRWQVDSIGIATNNNRRVEVYDNKVYVLTDWRVHCFDAFTGQKLWAVEMPHHTHQIDFFHSRPFAINGKVVINSTSDYMYCFDANTAQHLWTVNNFTASANQDLLEHNGVIYLSSGGSGRLLGVDLETGQILMNERSPNRNSSFAGYNVIVNKEKNLLFLNDYKSAYAYRPVR